MVDVEQARARKIDFCNRLYPLFGTGYAFKIVPILPPVDWVIFLPNLLRFVVIGFLLSLLPACTPTEVYQDKRFNPPVYWGVHVVEGGDTLYSIAWRYGRDYEELADINGIKAPYNIYPGQKVDLSVPKGYVKKTRQVADSKKTETKRSVKTPTTKVEKPAVNKKIQTPVAKVYKPTLKGKVKWSWPHTGPIIERFNVAGDINKGIDIRGNIGDPVRAAAQGEVVYAGSGLLGYGNLVIVNHNETYLSAYAHNRRMFVKEGDLVKTGQVIAELGDSGTKISKLHFEIRKNGKPVNPLHYLPKR